MPVNTCAAFGSFTKLIVEPKGSPTTFDGSSERYSIIAETMGVKRGLQGRRRITGDLSQWNGAFRQTSYMVQGAIVIQASPKDIHAWMPRVLWNPAGTSGGASTYTVGDAADDYIFDILIDRENDIFRYTNCRVARCVIRSETESGQQPQNEELLQMILYIVGQDETFDTAWPGTEPALTLSGAYTPYAHWEGVYTQNANVTKYSEFELDINNKLVPLFYNSQTPSCFRSAGRSVTMKLRSPFLAGTLADSISMLNTAAEASLVLTHTGTAGLSTTFTLPGARSMYETPVARNKGEIPLQLDLEAARLDGSTPEITITNDHTPS